MRAAGKDGTLSLIVGLGVKDRPSCNTITIVDKVGSKFESNSILAAYGAAEEVKSCVRDVKNNGNLDLVLNIDVGAFIGRCDATWPVIYGWTGDNYTNISGSFPEFYSNRLAEIARTKPSENDYQCLQAESARIQELLGVANSIALKTIVLIANSKDPNDRRFAADVLMHLNDPIARSYLRKLVKDPSPIVTNSVDAFFQDVKSGAFGPPKQFDREWP